MTLELLDSLSLPGNPAKANEDAFAHDAGAAAVFDGATPLGDSLMPGPSDAAWIAQFGARRFLAHLHDGDGARKALRGALADAQKSFAALARAPIQDVWQTPCASMMAAVETPEGLEFLWYGDCAALLRHDGAVTVIGETFDKRAAEAMRARQLAQEHKLPPAADLRRPEILTALRRARDRVGSGDYWLFVPDVKAAAHVARRIVPAAPGSFLLLCSDGFLALASDYGAYDPGTLMDATLSKGLAALGAELRAIEAGDAGGEKFPRFKPSDDATALLLRLA